MIFTVIISILLSYVQCSTSVPPQTIYHNSYKTTTASNAYINFVMTLSPYCSSVLLVIGTINSSVSVNRQDWIHTDPIGHTQFDFQGMVVGRNQYAWIKNPGINSTIFIKIINFQHQPVDVVITITESNNWVSSCTVASPFIITNNYCPMCPNSLMGVYCNITRNSLGPQTQMNLILNAYSYNNIILQTGTTIYIQLSFSAEVRIYLLDQVSPNEYAGMVNYFSGSMAEGQYIQDGKGSLSINIDAKGNILIGILNTNFYSVKFQVIFKQIKGVNIMIIVIGILGGLLLIGLIIGAFFLIKRIRNSQRLVVQPEIQTVVRRNKNMTASEIQFYFPAVPYSVIYSKLERSLSNFSMQIQDEKQRPRNECIICLCELQIQQVLRAGYCKHVFHANCLYQWFTKQQNCPYCRKDYQKKSTVEMYNSLKKSSGKVHFQGEEIVKQIFKVNTNLSLNTLQICDITEQH